MVVGQELVVVVVVVEGESEGRTRRIRRAREAKDSITRPGTVPAPLKNNDVAIDPMRVGDLTN